jgi:hypothetical protein
MRLARPEKNYEMRIPLTDKAIKVKRSVPVTHHHYNPDDFSRWKDAMKAWIESGRSDARVFGPLSAAAKSGRIICFNGAPRSHGFAEAFVAAQLEKDGFDCWTGVQLFPWNGRRVVAHDRRRNTDAVEAFLENDGIVVPRSLLPRLAQHQQAHGRLKNPDLVCRHRKTGEWRFLEVKRDEATEKGQLWALVLLQFLTGGSVGIHRLIPDTRRLPANTSKTETVRLSAAEVHQR